MKSELNCGHERFVEQIIKLTGTRNGESFAVEAPALVCVNCGFSTISNKQSGKFTQAVSDAYRRAHGLLTTADLQGLRKRYGVSQVQFAEYLGVGAASVKRWECGQIQDKAMDELIRLKTDPDAALRNANKLNATRQVLLEAVKEQLYSPRIKIALDTSTLDKSGILAEFDEALVA